MMIIAVCDAAAGALALLKPMQMHILWCVTLGDFLFMNTFI